MFKLIKWFIFLAIIALGYMFYMGWQAKQEEDRASIKSGLIDLIDKGETDQLKKAVKNNLEIGKNRTKKQLKDAFEKYMD